VAQPRNDDAVVVPPPASRYRIGAELGVGGMASVHLGLLLGAGGFARVVAIKRLHAHLRQEPEVREMLLDEALLASKVRHPNVVAVIDTFTTAPPGHAADLHLVMEYVDGLPLSQLVPLRKKAARVPPAIAVGLVVDALAGLHAVHVATDERGRPLGIVHRDVSPHNLLLGADGVLRVTDFGIARAAHRLGSTRHGERKGKASYMAPEQIDGRAPTPATDVFAAAIVLVELLTGRRLFRGETELEIFEQIRAGAVLPPGSLVPALPPELDALVLGALAHEPAQRPASAQAFAEALTSIVPRASAQEIAAWAAPLGAEALATRALRVAELMAAADAADAEAATVAAPAPGARGRAGARARAIAGWTLGGIAALLVLGAALGSWRRSAEEARAAPSIALASSMAVDAPEAASAPRQSASVASFAARPVGEATAPRAPASRSTPSTLSAESAASAPPPGTGRRPTAVDAGTARATRTAPARAAPRTPDCDPPWVLDSIGRRIYRRECL
jgi:serine/threonine-protein kinase